MEAQSILSPETVNCPLVSSKVTLVAKAALMSCRVASTSSSAANCTMLLITDPTPRSTLIPSPDFPASAYTPVSSTMMCTAAGFGLYPSGALVSTR